ncbi:MAG: hypothetical protein PHF37_05825 [Phycisphaerae bacterium]|jgi:hypothetical protein|nr:hypothetical protein [Phycisphaerae bacterium]
MSPKLLVLLLSCCLFAAGCTAEQLQTAQDVLKVQQVVDAKTAAVESVWADPNLTQAEKQYATAVILGQGAVDTGLTIPADNNTLMTIMQTALTTYVNWNPSKVSISMLIALALVALRKKK